MNPFTIGLYLSCVLTSAAVTFFLIRGYRQTRMRLLFWSALCFAGLTINNIILLVDLAMLPEVPLRPWRLGTSLIAVLFLLYGFIWEAE